MKKGIKKILNIVLMYLCRTTAVLFSYSMANRLKKFKAKLHTFWIRTEFKTIGEFSVINYPIDLRGGKYISIGSRVGIGKRGALTAWDQYRGDVFIPEIIIGNNTSIGDEFHITAINKIFIGNNVLMGKKITVTDNGHGMASADQLDTAPIDRLLYSKGPVIIEDGVWIGDKVTILANVTIGKNSIIGANALVTKNIPSNCVAGGVPATVIKTMEII
jgi:acetyltransferase-like isoleucine patch superfamily enzyme